MPVTIEKRLDTVVIRPSGDLTAAAENTGQLRQELTALANWGQIDLVVQLDQVDSIDCHGLAVLVICNQILRHKDRQLTVVTDNKAFHELFALARMDYRFSISTSDTDCTSKTNGK